MDAQRFGQWLARYGQVWESRYPEGVVDLYSPDVLYYWTPFEPPKVGIKQIATASRETSSRQDNIDFSYEVVTVNGKQGWARWWCSFDRITTGRKIRLDGVLQATFDDDDRCIEFREWWHSDEPASERPSDV